MKLVNLVFASAFGLMDRFGKDSFAVAKIRAAEYYLVFVRMLRNQTLAAVMTMITAFAVTNLLLVIEISILLFTPWSVAVKVASAVAVGLLGFGITVGAVFHALSQEKWMRLTGADQVFADAIR